MASAGSLWISVKPSLEGFGQSVRQQLRQELPGDQTVAIRGDVKDLQQKLADAKARLTDLSRQHADPVIDAKAEGLEQAIAQAKAKLADLQRTKTDPKVDADIAVAEGRIAQVKAKLDELAAKKATPKVEADTAVAQGQLQQLQVKLDELNAKRVDPKVTAQGIAETEADIAALEGQLSALDGKRTDPEVRAQTEQARGEIASLSAQLDALGSKRATARVDVDTSGARGQTNLLMSAIVALSPAAVTAGAVAAAGLAAIGNGAIAGLAGVLTLKAAFSGIGEAIKAYDADQKSAATSAASSGSAASDSANKIASAQQQVTSSERSLEQARAHAADSAVSAAEQVQKAQQSVVSAQRDAASAVQSAVNQQISAQESLINAERSLEDAERSETLAQQNLTQARRDAALAIQNLGFSVQDNALNQRGAQLSLQDALRQQAGNAGTGDSLQSAKDQLAVDQARQRITELAAQGKDLAAQKADSDRKGVEGSSQVVSAQNAVTDAVERTRKAQQGLGDAQRAVGQAAAAVAKAQTDGADKIRAAEQSVADARRQQAIQARDGAASIASAQDGVTSAQRSLKEATDKVGESLKGGAGAAKQFGYAMSQLSPAGRDFVNFYTSQLKPKLDDLKKAAQEGLFPGLTEGIKTAFPVFDQLKTIVSNVSTTFGGLAREAGKALTNPFWHNFFDFVGKTAGPSIKILSESFGRFLTGTAGLIQALYEPVFKPLLGWLEGLSKKYQDFGTSAAAGKNAGFNKFVDYIKENGPKLGELLRQAGEMMKKVGEALAQIGPGEIDAFSTLLSWINKLPEPVVKALVELFVAAKLWALVKVPISGINDAYNGIKKIASKLAEMRAAGGLKGALGLAGGVVGTAAVLGFADDATDGGVASAFNSISGAPQVDRNKTGDFGSQLGKLVKGDVAGAVGADAAKPGDYWDVRNLGSKVGDIATNKGGVTDSIDKSVNDALANVFKSIGRWFANLGKSIGKWWNDDVWGPTSRFFASLPASVGKWWNDNVWGPTSRFFSGLGKTVGKWWNDDVWTPTKNFFTGLPGTISKWWNDNVWGPTSRFFSGLGKTVGKWWNDDVWTPTKNFFTGLPGTISKWWNDNVWTPTTRWFSNLGKTIGRWWTDNVWTPTKNFFTGLPGTITKWWNDNVWTPTTRWFSSLGKTIGRWWTDNVWTPTKNFFTGLPGTVRRWWDDNVWTPTTRWFTDVGKVIGRWWDDHVSKPIGGAAQRMADGVARAFASIRRAAAVPINFLVQTVYGHGLVPAWNWVAGLVGLPPLPAPGPPIPELATGGPIPTSRVGSGFVTDGPRAIVGEGNQSFPEFVVPTDPAHRARAEMLYGQLGAQLGMPMLADGGILGSLGGLVGNVWGAVRDTTSDVAGWVKGKIGDVVAGTQALFTDPVKFVTDLLMPTGAGLDQFAGSGIGQDLLHLLPKIVSSLAGKAKSGVDAQQAAAGGGSGMMGPPGDGQIFVIQQISDSARAHGVGFPGDVIGVATGIVESGLRNLNYGDRDSVGVFQQRGNGAWGSLAERMNVRHAADMFFNKLVSFNWRAMDPGAAAQKVQVSAFPGRYGAVMGQAAQLVTQFGGKFDEGGMLMPGLTAAINASGKPERVLTANQNASFERMVAHATKDNNGAGQGVALNFPNAVFRDPVDVDMVAQRMDFAAKAAGFG